MLERSPSGHLGAGIRGRAPAIMPPLMTDQQRSAWMSTEDAARRIGVSPATIKRRIADGKPVRRHDGSLVVIEAEQVQRPQGHEWQVRILGDPPPLSTDQERSDSIEQPTAQEPSGSLTGALLARLDERDETIAELYGRIAALEREAGTQAARANGLEAQLAAERERRERAEQDASRLRERRWWKPSTW